MDKERYTMAEAAKKLGVSNKTLVNWVNMGGLREAVEAQVFEYDKRAHYLTRQQLEKLAKDHRVKITAAPDAPITSLLTEEIRDLSSAVSALIAKTNMIKKNLQHADAEEIRAVIGTLEPLAEQIRVIIMAYWDALPVNIPPTPDPQSQQPGRQLDRKPTKPFDHELFSDIMKIDQN